MSGWFKGKIPLGIAVSGEAVEWDMDSDPHLLVVANSANELPILELIANSLSSRNDGKRLTIIDDTASLLSKTLQESPNISIHLPENLEQFLEVCFAFEQEMNSNKDSEDFPIRVLFVHSYAQILSLPVIGKEPRPALLTQFHNFVKRVLESGGKTKTHLIMSTQAPVARALSAELIPQFPARWAGSQLSHLASLILLENDSASKLATSGRLNVIHLSGEDILFYRDGSPY